VFQTLPGYHEKTDQRFIFLITQSKYSIVNSPTCVSLLGQLNFHMDDLEAFDHITYAASIVFAVFYVGVMPCIIWILLAPCFTDNKRTIIERTFYGAGCVACIQVVPTIVIFVMSLTAKRNAEPGISFIQSLTGQNCFQDGIFNNTINDIANFCSVLMMIYTMILAIFILSMALVGVTIAMGACLEKTDGNGYEPGNMVVV